MSLRVESLADLPQKARAQAAAQIIRQQKQRKKPAKYKNVKTTVDGITFDSKREADRFCLLREMLSTGRISDLKLQVRYVLQEGFTGMDGVKVRPIEYVADFVYRDYAGRIVVEDAKGCRTDVFKLKKKMAAERGINIVEV